MTKEEWETIEHLGEIEDHRVLTESERLVYEILVNKTKFELSCPKGFKGVCICETCIN